MITEQELAEKVRLGLVRRQVLASTGRLEQAIRKGQVGLVWITEDLSRSAAYKVRTLCRKGGVPVLCWGRTQTTETITGITGGKVYILLNNFPALKRMLQDLAEKLDET